MTTTQDEFTQDNLKTKKTSNVVSLDERRKKDEQPWLDHAIMDFLVEQKIRRDREKFDNYDKIYKQILEED
jgi:predicted ATPase